MGCDTIVAQPNTITGSIGVFGLFFGAQELLDKIGVSVDVVKTSPLADILDPSQPLGPREERVIQSFVDKGYETFVSKVAQGRGMTVAQVKELAGGRVYTGKEPCAELGGYIRGARHRSGHCRPAGQPRRG